MRNLRCILALAAISTFAATATGCMSGEEETVDSANGAVTAGAPTGPTPIAGSSLKLPVPGSTGNRISAADQATIVKAWLGAKRDFYDAPKYDTARPNGAVAPAAPAYSEVASVPCGASYSTLICRFYAHMPSYASVIPNFRGCFSYMANGGLKVPTSLWDSSIVPEATTTRPSTYAEAFDHCLYQPYDKVLNLTPPWSTTEVAKNKAARNEVGVVKYMSAELRPVFKFLMYTWYEPETFDRADQAAILQSVYQAIGTSPPAVGLGRTHQDTATIYVPAMNAYIAANKTL